MGTFKPLLALVAFWGLLAQGQEFRFENLLQREDVIWGFDFLGDGQIIFTERNGAMGVFDPKSKATLNLKGVPKVWANGQGGLLDIRVHPKDKLKIFFTYSEPVGKGATTALAVATLGNGELTGVKKIFSALEANTNEIHFGSRIEFDEQGYIFITVGDRNQRERAQDKNFHQGKIIRLKEDGSAAAEIWSLGHRSPQGLVRDPVTKDLWMAEMGPRGGDEVNLVRQGANYGWPLATYGREYFGPKIGQTEKAGTEQPVVYWVPSISPSALTVYRGKAFPKWNGNLFLACLSGTQLRRLVLQGHKVTQQEELLKDMGQRFRNVRVGPDGFLYLSTDSGKIARLVPK